MFHTKESQFQKTNKMNRRNYHGAILSACLAVFLITFTYLNTKQIYRSVLIDSKQPHIEPIMGKKKPFTRILKLKPKPTAQSKSHPHHINKKIPKTKSPKTLAPTKSAAPTKLPKKKSQKKKPPKHPPSSINNSNGNASSSSVGAGGGGVFF